ncbi:hypothetical protein AXX17_AT5G31590 [Arabidopsis thaliana]|uniref:Uncharacterized protein n=1 Tax=Arabidopsis thaliana TaxID=3702 RepID=A0A178US59_ARATH|nr:hypothetical protein AXX17_AT5G31590 [Arabidopsis thaliana]
MLEASLKEKEARIEALETQMAEEKAENKRRTDEMAKEIAENKKSSETMMRFMEDMRMRIMKGCYSVGKTKQGPGEISSLEADHHALSNSLKGKHEMEDQVATSNMSSISQMMSYRRNTTSMTTSKENCREFKTDFFNPTSRARKEVKSHGMELIQGAIRFIQMEKARTDLESDIKEYESNLLLLDQTYEDDFSEEEERFKLEANLKDKKERLAALPTAAQGEVPLVENDEQPSLRSGDGFEPSGVLSPHAAFHFPPKDKKEAYGFIEKANARSRIARVERKVRALESDHFQWEWRNFDSVAKIATMLQTFLRNQGKVHGPVARTTKVLPSDSEEDEDEEDNNPLKRVKTESKVDEKNEASTSITEPAMKDHVPDLSQKCP